MAVSYGNMILRERIEDNNQRRTLRSEERAQDSSDRDNVDARKKILNPLKKKVDGRGSKYDQDGRLKEIQKDVCDCLVLDCPGCFMKCPDCGSQKCGHECRRSRRWVYESYEIEGTSCVVYNPYIKK